MIAGEDWPRIRDDVSAQRSPTSLSHLAQSHSTPPPEAITTRYWYRASIINHLPTFESGGWASQLMPCPPPSLQMVFYHECGAAWLTLNRSPYSSTIHWQNCSHCEVHSLIRVALIPEPSTPMSMSRTHSAGVWSSKLDQRTLFSARAPCH